MTKEVLFERQDDAFLPTILAGSPWHPAMLHGGAPAALLAHCLEQAVGSADMQPTRLTIDLVRPVPRAPLQVSLRRLREGKRIQLLEAILSADKKPVAIATALFAQPQSVVVPHYAPQQTLTLVDPDTLPDTNFRDVLFAGNDNAPPGLHTTVVLRAASKLSEQGQGKAWLKLPVPVVEGVSNTPFMLAALVSDFSNGVGQLALDKRTGMINADISLQLLRLPQSEWIGLDARTFVHGDGLAMVQAQLFDSHGLIGQVMQSAMPTAAFSR